MTTQQRRYRAFISYSQKNKPVARRIHRALETFRVPRGVEAAGLDAKTRRLGRFFRDDEEMGAASDLGATLRGAIADSDGLIVICSPEAARSQWVNQEIAHFKTTGRSSRIFAVIVSGTPNATAPGAAEQNPKECFPPALRFEVDAEGMVTDKPSEPLAIDLRKENLSRVKTRLAAGLLGVNFDDLWKRDQRRKQGQALTWGAIATVLVAATSGGAFWSMTSLDTAAKAAEEQRLQLLMQRATAAIDVAEARSSVVEDLKESGAEEASIARELNARKRAAALTYAFALSGGDDAKLMERLGFARTLFLPETATLSPGKGWAWGVAYAADYSTYKLMNLATSEAKVLEGVLFRPLMSPDGAWLATQEENNERLGFWNLATGARHAQFAPPEGSYERIFSTAYSPNSKLLAAASQVSVWLLDPATGKVTAETKLPQDPSAANSMLMSRAIGAVAFSIDGSRLIVADDAKGINVYDLRTSAWLPRKEAKVRVVGEGLYPLANPAEILLEATYSDDAVRDGLWKFNIETGETSAITGWWCTPEDEADYSQNCQARIESVSRDGSVALVYGLSLINPSKRFYRVYRFDGGTPQVDIPAPDCTGIVNTLQKTCGLAVFHLSQDGRLVAASHGTGSLMVVDTVTGKSSPQMISADLVTERGRLSADGKRMIGLIDQPLSYDDGSQLIVWDTGTGQMISQSGRKIDGLVELVGDRADRVTVDDVNADAMSVWTAIGPVDAETPYQALQRICAMPGWSEMVIGAADAEALPRGASLRICEWPAPKVP